MWNTSALAASLSHINDARGSMNQVAMRAAKWQILI